MKVNKAVMRRVRVLNRIKLWIVAILRWFGPVNDSVRGTLTSTEWVRAFAQAAIAGGATRAGMTSREAVANVWLPLLVAFVTGLLAALNFANAGPPPGTAVVPLNDLPTLDKP